MIKTARSAPRALQGSRRLLSFQLPALSFDPSALQPVLSADIMTLHHSKHHATYVNNLNAANEKLADAQAKGDISAVIALQGAIKFNGGGEMPSDDAGKSLQSAIEAQWGSLDGFKEKFAAQTVAVQGSGWGWLGYDKATGRLAIATCANQDPLEATTGLVPLLGVDVWEHAYYLDYKNVRPDYVKNIWKVVNWKDVASRFTAAKA